MSEVQNNNPINTNPSTLTNKVDSGTKTFQRDPNRPARQSSFGRDVNRSQTSPTAARPPFGNRPAYASSTPNSRPGFSRGGSDRPNPRFGNRNKPISDVQELESKVIEVRRVTRVVKGGKRMRFSALVVVGDRLGKVGFGLKKGLDFQDAVAKATKKANGSLIKISMDKNKSVLFTSNTKHKSSEIFLKPAAQGIGLIAGGFIRPVLELAGIENAYTKINRSRNKIPGVQCVIKALEKYSTKPSTVKTTQTDKDSI